MTFTPSTGSGAYTSSQIYNIIDTTASESGVDPTLALATAQQESGFNPYAVGDGGTSFGLYQLHQGGLLGSMPPSQATDPQANATKAIANIAGIHNAYPFITDPGTIAAMAQRPANPTAYAQAVDKRINDIQTKGLPTAQVFVPTNQGWGATTSPNQTNTKVPTGGNTSGSAAGGTSFNPFNPASWFGYLERFVFMILGVIIIVMGIYMLFNGKSAGDTIQLLNPAGGGGDSSSSNKGTSRTAKAKSMAKDAGEAAEVAG